MINLLNSVGREVGISTGVCKSESLIIYLCRRLLRPPKSKQMHELKIFFFWTHDLPQICFVTMHCKNIFFLLNFSRSASRLCKPSLKKLSPSKAFLSGKLRVLQRKGYTNRGSATRRPPTNSGLFSDLSVSFQSLLSSSYADNSIRLSFSFVIWKILYQMWRICVPI